MCVAKTKKRDPYRGCGRVQVREERGHGGGVSVRDAVARAWRRDILKRAKILEGRAKGREGAIVTNIDSLKFPQRREGLYSETPPGSTRRLTSENEVTRLLLKGDFL